MKTLTSLFLLLMCGTVLAQHDMASVQERVKSITDDLQNRNIENYFTTMRYCNGETQMFKMPDGSRCFSQGNYVATYVVWMEGENTYIKKTDNCGSFASVMMTSNNVFNYFMENSTSLQNKKVKPYEIAGRAGGPISRLEVKDCHREYTFVTKDGKGVQKFKPFDLTNSAREANVNYEYNSSLSMAAFEQMMEEAVADLEENPKNRRE